MKTPAAWWGSRKSSTKSKEQQQQQKEKSSSEQKNKQSTSPHGNNKHDLSKSSIRNDKIEKEINRPRSFDEPALSSSRNSPRTSRDLTSGGSGRGGGVVGGSGSSGFSGFDSERGHPLPRPTSLGIDLGAGLGSGSVSISSVSSSGSSEDQNQIDQTQFGIFRGRNEMKLSPRARSPTALSPRTRSPGPGSRITTAATSPRHPRYFGNSMESSTGRLDEGRSEFHPLPLPPGSPTSPPSLPSTRACTVTESTHSYASKWKKGKLLGRGTFGHVYLGFNSDGGHMCAIKEVKVIADDQSSKECLKQLNQEITLLSQLSHPNIVQYYGSELCEETLSVYLEYVSGGSIHKLLQEYGAFREPVIRNYTKQILAGLAYLHGRNTVHRDIKGANILVDPNGEIKLADFGMAKHITACSSMLSFKGSPYWMAPEVVMNTNGYNLQVDIWSLGCTILEMATSKPPWSKYEGVAAIFKIGNSKDIPEIPDHLSADAKSFIKLCLQREPSARPTALQLLDHPFVRDLTTSRSGNINLNKEAFPPIYDGSRTPTALDIRSSRTNTSSVDGLLTPSRAIVNPRENARMIASLPVSPCSSPLRTSGPSYPSYFQSPPHPSYTLAGGGQNGYNLNDYSLAPARTNPKYSLDLWREVPQFKAQTPPGGSPRIRRVELGL